MTDELRRAVRLLIECADEMRRAEAETGRPTDPALKARLMDFLRGRVHSALVAEVATPRGLERLHATEGEGPDPELMV